MNRITFPLTQRMQDGAVADLQDVLQQILERGLILPNDPDARRELSAAFQRERAERIYGAATSRAVSFLSGQAAVAGQRGRRSANGRGTEYPPQ
jgi:hypothetical protein